MFLRVPHMHICMHTDTHTSNSLIWPDEIIKEATPTDNKESGTT